MKQFVLIAIIGVIAPSTLALEDYKLDLVTPIQRIRDQIDVTIAKPPNWSQLPQLISALLPCLSTTPFKLDTAGILPGLERYLEQTNPAALVKEMASMVDWKEFSTLSSVKQSDDSLLDDLKEYMKTPSFKTVHDQIWKSDSEFLDVR